MALLSEDERLLKIEGALGASETRTSARSAESPVRTSRSASISLEYDIRKEIAQLEAEEAEAREQLQQLDVLWQRRRQPLEEDANAKAAAVAQLKQRLNLMTRPRQEMPPAPGPANLSFVDGSGFSTLCNLVVFANLACMLFSWRLEQEHLSWSVILVDHACLAWYLVELGLKARYHQWTLLFGKPHVVWWNWLDLGIVASGVVDQWLLPLLGQSQNLKALSGFRALRMLRVFRVMRAFKLLKACIFGDLSWLEEPRFQFFMAGVIGVNSITMWLELDYEWPIWPYLESTFLVLYTFELMAKVKHAGLGFFSDPDKMVWNVLDFIMVVCGVLDIWLVPAASWAQSMISGQPQEEFSGFDGIMSLLKLMRIMRVLRLVRLLRATKPLYWLLTGVVQAIMAMQWVVILTFLVLYAAAITWTALIGKSLMNPPSEAAKELFGTVPSSLFTLFMLMNGDTDIVEPITNTVFTKLLIAMFMVLSNWAVLAILTAVVSDNMMTSSTRAMQEDKKKQQAYEHTIRANRLHDLFRRCDGDADGAISKKEWDTMLRDPMLRAELLDAAALPLHAVEDMFECMAQPGYADDDEGPVVVYTKFLENVSDAASPADNRSVMYVTSQIRVLQAQVEKIAEAVARSGERKHPRLLGNLAPREVAAEWAPQEKRQRPPRVDTPEVGSGGV